MSLIIARGLIVICTAVRHIENKKPENESYYKLKQISNNDYWRIHSHFWWDKCGWRRWISYKEKQRRKLYNYTE